MSDERESIQVTIKAKSQKAWLMEDKTGHEAWCAFSQCDIVPSSGEVGDDVWLMIPEWLLRKTELT